MKVTLKTYFFFKNKTTYYTFREKDFENYYPLLEKLEDGRFKFDNNIYDADFLDFQKVECYLQIFYNKRLEYINENFKLIYERYERSCSKNHKRFLSLNSIKNSPKLDKVKIKRFEPNLHDIWYDLTLEQYEILVNAYCFDFEFGSTGIHIRDFFPEAFYEIGWRSIKPVFAPYKDALYKHYDDDDRYHVIRNPIREGTYCPKELFEYSDEKKYNEYDIYSTTNTYTKRCIYNEIFYANYTGKKHGTEMAYDFTDDEIKANFDNMVNKKGLEKFNFVLENEKNRRYLFELVKKLVNIEYHKIADTNIWAGEYIFWKEREWYDVWSYEEVKAQFYDILNDPRNILILPVIDAWIELYRPTGWYKGVFGDKTFVNYDYTKFKRHTKMMFLYTLTLEYQEYSYHWFGIGPESYEWWFIDAEYDDKEDWFYYFSVVGFLFFWFVGFTAYLGGYLSPVINIPYNLLAPVEDIYVLYQNYENVDQSLHLSRQIVVWKPRCFTHYRRHYILPPNFYFDQHFSFSKRKNRGMLPYGYMERIYFFINDRDFLVRKIHDKLWRFGDKLGYR